MIDTPTRRPPTRRTSRTLAGLVMLAAALASCDRPDVGALIYAGAEPLERDSTFERQRARNDCGVAAAAIFLRASGATATYAALAGDVRLTEEGMSLTALKGLLERRGVRTEGVRLAPGDLEKLSTPFVAWLPIGHYVVVRRETTGDVVVSDPGSGRWRVPIDRWWRIWDGTALIHRSEMDDVMGPTPTPHLPLTRQAES